ncbi:MAG: HAD-IB family phosphatase, partial [Deltaproteobacteria bacterium]|nr:HAD-IB family phosphatase [Deltaproteobacteria bacterium]
MTSWSTPPTQGLLAPGRWSKGLRAALEAMVVREAPEPGGPPLLATFDWDNTCIRGDLAEGVLETLDEREGTRRFATYLSLIEEVGELEAYVFCTTTLAGRTEPALRALALEVWEERLADGRIAERPEMPDLFSALERHGWEVWIVSAAAEILVQVAAERYGLDPDRVIGVRLAVGKDQMLQDRVVGPFPHREGKIAVIEQRIGRHPAFATGNADSDIEMLEAARFRLVINNGSTELREIANQGGWWVQT